MSKGDKKQQIGFYLVGASVLIFLLGFFFLEHTEKRYTPIVEWHPILLFLITVLLLFALCLIFNFRGILFDNKEYEPNSTISKIVVKIRLRGVLFNNIAIILFLLTIFIIFISFYLLVNPPIEKGTPDNKALIDSLTVRIAASALLIFLVQILFKVFKYLLRVAAFYNARADAIEYHQQEPKIELDKLMDMFTPEKYDISELEKTSLFDGIAEAIKSKASKL